MRLEDIENTIGDAGLAPRGAFHPGPEDGVPRLPDGRSAGTEVLVGNVGPAMWQAFSTARDPGVDKQDDWSAEVLTGVARRFEATACFPFSHIPTPAGEDCVELGCRVRRACPVGRAYRYPPAQARFHMTHFLRCHGARQRKPPH